MVEPLLLIKGAGFTLIMELPEKFRNAGQEPRQTAPSASQATPVSSGNLLTTPPVSPFLFRCVQRYNFLSSIPNTEVFRKSDLKAIFGRAEICSDGAPDAPCKPLCGGANADASCKYSLRKTPKNAILIHITPQGGECPVYRIAICEDELSMAQENEAMVCRILEARCFRRNVDFSIAGFSSAESLLASLQKHSGAFHLLLLDIRLAQENGLELAAYLRETNLNCSIIYITAYEEYMPDSFATRPLDYLVKPVDKQKLAKAIDWDLRRNYLPEQITLPVKGGFRKAVVQDILYGEAVNHKSVVYLPGEAVPVNLSFRDLLSRLPGDMFCRCHYSFVVNLKHVHKRTAHGLLLDTGLELPVSRTYQQEITRQFVASLQ